MAKSNDGTTTAVETPTYTLVVAHPFGDHERGSAITDPAEIAEVMVGENAHHVRKVPL
jgi:hypothetical protein